MYEITVTYLDGTFFQVNNIVSTCYMGGELIIVFRGMFGDLCSMKINDTVIRNFSMRSFGADNVLEQQRKSRGEHGKK